MSDMGFMCWTVCMNAAISQFAITIGKELTTHHAAYYKLDSYFMDGRTWLS
jgi:hypothetical protein